MPQGSTFESSKKGLVDNIYMPRTKTSPRFINTRKLFSVKDILLSRGFEVLGEDDVAKLIITEENEEDEIWGKLFYVFNSTKHRTELKNYLYKGGEVSTAIVLEIINHSKFVKKHQRFDNTFEWYAGELMVQRFAALSFSFGIQVKDILRNTTSSAAGDYDSLVVLRDTSIAYFECKAGSYDNTMILKCYERMLSLNCEYSILFCAENIDEKKVIWETSRVKIPVVNLHYLNKINVKGNKQDFVYDLNNCYIMDMSGNIANKIRTVLRVNAAKINQLHYAIGLDEETYNKLGYEINTINEVRYSDIIDSKIIM